MVRKFARTVGIWALAATAGGMLVSPLWAASTKRASPAPKGYSDAVKKWHEPPAGAVAPKDATGRPLLVLTTLAHNERLELTPRTDNGGFDAYALDRASHLLRDQRTGLTHPVEPSLLDTVYMAQRHFAAPEVRVISGYRIPKPKSRSNHGRGRAMDLVLPGVSDEQLVAWAKGLGFTGVGRYPRSGFCHLDVRPQSYFWVDRSGPRQRNRETPVGRSLAAHSDLEARKQRRRAIGPFALPSSAVFAIWKNGTVETTNEEADGFEDEDHEP